MKLYKEFDTYKDEYKLQIVKPFMGSLFIIHVTKGSVPKSLTGMYTGIAEAEEAIRSYLTNEANVPNTSKNHKEGTRDKLVNQAGREFEG